MDSILTYEANKESDLYAILGCDEQATEEQIVCEYKCRARDCHPDKHPDDPEAAQKFARLQYAKCVLTNSEDRADYDKWRRSGLAMPYNEWKARKASIHTSLHWAQKVKREPMILDTASNRPTQPCSFEWNPAPANDILRRFRNYEI